MKDDLAPGRARIRRVAVRFAGLLIAALLAVPAGAEEPACKAGSSLVPSLEADGRMAKIEAEAARTPNGTGRFWRIERDGTPPSWLFGTMHLSDPRVLALPEPAKAAFGKARTVVIETLDVLDNKADALVLAHPELMLVAGGAKTLDDVLPAVQRDELRRLLDASGTPFESVRTLQPWFYSAGLMLPACEAARMLTGAHPLDVAIALDAKAAGKEVIGLESALDQLRVLASMPINLQAESLIAVLKVRDMIPDLFETMTELYLAGRVAAITPLSELALPVDEMPQTLQDAYRDFEKRIVVDRNHSMADGLRPYLEKGGAFVAVGALHLVGEEGLVELLRQDGYRLSRAD